MPGMIIHLGNPLVLLLQLLNLDFQAVLHPPMYLETRHLELRAIHSAVVSRPPVIHQSLGEHLQLQILYLVVHQLLAVI